MVTYYITMLGSLIAQVSHSPWSRLSQEQRARLGGSLTLVAVAGVALVVLAWLMLRVGRRRSRREDEAWDRMRERASSDDWAEKPLVSGDSTGQGSELE